MSSSRTSKKIRNRRNSWSQLCLVAVSVVGFCGAYVLIQLRLSSFVVVLSSHDNGNDAPTTKSFSTAKTTTTTTRDASLSNVAVAPSETQVPRKATTTTSDKTRQIKLVKAETPLFLHQIIQNRHLTNPNNRTLRLLEQILFNDEQNPYNATTDILVFEHALKSGGTSLSVHLKKLFRHGVVPGSKPSKPFAHEEYWKFIENHKPTTTTTTTLSTTSKNNTTGLRRPWRALRHKTTPKLAAAVAHFWQLRAKVIYSHDMMNSHADYKQVPGVDGNMIPISTGASKLERFLQNQLSAIGWNVKPTNRRKFRVLAMIRDPVPFVASNMAEWMCRSKARLDLAMELGYHNGTLDINRDLYNNTMHENSTRVERIPPCFGFTFQNLYDIWMKHIVLPVCKQQHAMEPNKNMTFPKHVLPEHCQVLRKGGTPMGHCQSATQMLETPDVFLRLHDNKKGLLPLDVYLKHKNDDDAMFASTHNSDTSVSGSTNPNSQKESTRTNEEYEYHALMRLGGLTAQHKSYMMWHGIPDKGRMEESLCLFHFMTRIPFPQTPIPTNRQKSCRPISYWKDEEIAMLKQREGLGQAVSRVAHALLDARMAKMCRLLLHEGDSTNNEYAFLQLPVESCCANFRVDSHTGGLIQHVPSEIA